MAPSHNTGDCLIRARKSAAICYFLRIQDDGWFAHLCRHCGRANCTDNSTPSRAPRMKLGTGSVIIHHFAIKSSFFISLGACRLKRSVNRRILVLVLGLGASLSFLSCGSTSSKNGGSGLPERVLTSQGVTSTSDFGSLVIVDGYNDTIARAQRISTG